MTNHEHPSDGKVRVWDLAVRVFHWSVAALVLVAFLTAEEDETTPIHVRVGLVILGLVIFRVVWGFIGSSPARFRSFVRAPREVIAYARAYLTGRPPVHTSHNPLGAVMVLLLLGLLGAITATGILIQLGPQWGGPLSPWIDRSTARAIKEVHEVTAEMLPALIVLHVAGVLVSSWLERQNLIGGMITGRKRVEAALPLRAPSLGRRLLAFSVAALIGGSVAIGVSLILPIGTAEAAESPKSLLDGYAAEARAADPAFTGFDAAQGKVLYVTEHALNGKRSSCATCHTADPRSEGRSPVGKIIDPLAPAANPLRFTDRKEAEKWFERNCKQVLGRPCTPREKGDVLAWLLTW